MIKKTILVPILLLAASAASPALAQDDTVTLPTIELVATTPVSGSDIDLSAVASAVTNLSSKDFANATTPTVIDTMVKRVPSVSVANETGNQFEPDIQFRGFVATPLTGTPEGLAVYQNGTRVNEAFGDNVHWDFIPPDAIDTMELVSNNPIFGLNALGGAVNVQMKNGFTFQGIENDVSGGSYGRIEDSLQWGGRDGNLAAYFSVDAAHDDGFRKFSQSDIRRFYGDVGYKDAKTEVHLNATLADNFFHSPGTTPVDLLNQDYSAVFTTPQTDDLFMGMLSAQGSTQLTDTFKLSGTAYYRHFSDNHVDGNDTDVTQCDDDNPGLLCFGDDDGDPALDTKGNPISASIIPDGSTIGEIDRNNTMTNGWGGSVQATSTAPIGGMKNTLIGGLTYDGASTQFGANSELGTVGDDFVVTGNGTFLGNNSSDDGSIGPVGLSATSNYFGAYALDTLEPTDKLAITLGGRANFANINLNDELNAPGNSDGIPSLTGDHNYFHFNPVIGATYKLTPGITAYAGYSESNRAPTPLELGCSDPNHACIVDSFLVSDPDLQQVVSHTLEAGLRGNTDLGKDQKLNWSIGLFRTLNSNDIINTTIGDTAGAGYFANVGDTLRQGVEASVQYTHQNWSIYASYAYVDATYQSAFTVAAPEGYPGGDDDLQVVPGDHISGIPAHHLKIGADYQVNEKWTIGGDILAVSGSYFGGDESNQQAMLPGYATVGLHTTYQATKNVQFHAEVENLFNVKYSTYGTYFDHGDDGVGGLVPGNSPESVTPGLPFAVYAGLKITY